MSSIRNLCAEATAYLGKRGVVRARREAEELLAIVLGEERSYLYLACDCTVEKEKVDRYRNWIQRRGRREPFAYIVREVEFLGCRIGVSPDVLIPRQETEILVNLACKEIEGGVIWDLCTGSGCIGLAVKKRYAKSQVTLSDLSEGAIAVARENAKRNGLAVRLLQGDLLTPFSGEKADVIFCNPPYISESEYLALEPEVGAFEPKCALVAAQNGCDFFMRLSRDLPAFLRAGGKVFLEIGCGQKRRVESLFGASYWKKRICLRDWAGFDRFFFLEFFP